MKSWIHLMLSPSNLSKFKPYNFQQVQNKIILAWVLLLLLALIWGSSFILIKQGLLALSPGEVGALRIFTASVCMIPFAVTRIHLVQKGEWKFLITVGLMGSLLPSFLFAVAQTQLPSSITGVMNALTPIFTILIGWFLYAKRQTNRVIIGIILGFAGTALLITARSDGSFTINYYAFLVVLATVFYAVNVNIIKEHLQRLKSLAITSISLILVGPAAAIYLFGFTPFAKHITEGPEVLLATGYIVLLGIMGTAIALILFNKLVQLTDPVFTSSVTYLIPLVAVSWGLFDGESLILAQVIGIATILLGVYISNRTKKSFYSPNIKPTKK